MKKILAFIRAPEWSHSKIPVLLAVPLYYFALYPQTLTFGYQLKMLAVYFAFASLYGAFGYAINDFSDIEADKAAGKEKLIFAMAPGQALLAIIGLAVLGLIPFLLMGLNWTLVTILLVAYLLAASYSLKPLRLKERGGLGLLTAALTQRCMPLLVLLPLLDIPVGLLFLWVALGMLTGLRYILVHQILDSQSDLKTGIRTFALENGDLAVLLVYLVLAIELMVLVRILLPLLLGRSWILLVLAIYLLKTAAVWLALNRYVGQSFILSFHHAPLEDFYNIYLVLILLMVLVAADPRWLWILLATLLYLVPAILDKLGLPLLYLKAKLGKVRRSKLE